MTVSGYGVTYVNGNPAATISYRSRLMANTWIIGLGGVANQLNVQLSSAPGRGGGGTCFGDSGGPTLLYGTDTIVAVTSFGMSANVCGGTGVRLPGRHRGGPEVDAVRAHPEAVGRDRRRVALASLRVRAGRRNLSDRPSRLSQDADQLANTGGPELPTSDGAGLSSNTVWWTLLALCITAFAVPVNGQLLPHRLPRLR